MSSVVDGTEILCGCWVDLKLMDVPTPNLNFINTIFVPKSSMRSYTSSVRKLALSITWKFGFIKGLIKVKFLPSRLALRLRSDQRSKRRLSKSFTVAIRSLYQLVWSNQIFMLHSPTAAPQFLKKQEIFGSQWSSLCGLREPLMKYYGVIS